MSGDDWSDDLDDDYPDENEWDDDLDSETVQCDSCGAQIYEDAEQCPTCGQYLTGTTGIKPLWRWTAVVLLVHVMSPGASAS